MMSKELIIQFYTAFQQKDAEVMNVCYHDQITFYDPVFGSLEGERVKDMWRFLCSSGTKNFKLEFSEVDADNNKGKAHWEAHYPSRVKRDRIIHNIVNSSFEFKEGKIIKQTDLFDVKKWSIQALGFPANIIGGTQFFKNKLRKKANSALDDYLKNRTKEAS
jgi:hypothetical protein